MKEYVPYEKSVNVSIKESRATTDQSVALLNEFQDKARQSIIETIHIDSNYLKGVAVFFQNSMINCRVDVHVRFQLNDKEYRVVTYFDEHYRLTNPVDRGEFFLTTVYNKLSESIAAEIMKHNSEFFGNLIRSTLNN